MKWLGKLSVYVTALTFRVDAVMALSAGDTIFVGEQLKSQGLAGAIIITLMGVITLLVGAIVLMWRHSNKVYSYRLAERDTLNNALNESKNSIATMMAVSKERNEITDELADVIAKQAAIFEQLSDRIRMHYERLVDDNSRLSLVVTAISEAMRQVVAISTDNRNLSTGLVEMVGKVEKSLSDVKAVIDRPRQRATRSKV